MLKFDVTPAVDVDNVSVVSAKPRKAFDKQAKIALRQRKYKPSASGSLDILVQLDFALDK